MTQVALIGSTVPGSGGGIILDIIGGGASKQVRRVSDYVVCVVLAHIFVNSSTVDARSTSTAFEVEKECGVRDEFHITASERANNILCTMDGRVGVLWTHYAGQAMIVCIRLTIMLLQTILIDKDLIARRTIPVAVFVMVFQVTEVIEMIVAILAIRVARTLNPVFFQPHPGRKVLRTILADVVMRRIGFMLIEGRPRSK